MLCKDSYKFLSCVTCGSNDSCFDHVNLLVLLFIMQVIFLIIDLSADFRIKDVNRYEEWYGIKHQSPEFIDEAVYGLCEINREDIKKARLIANPGCYPTCSTLSIYPMAKEGLIEMNSVIIDAKSGTSGAGRGAKVNNLYCEVLHISKHMELQLTDIRQRSKIS